MLNARGVRPHSSTAKQENRNEVEQDKKRGAKGLWNHNRTTKWQRSLQTLGTHTIVVRYETK